MSTIADTPLATGFPSLEREARLPRHRRDVADAAAGARRDERLLRAPSSGRVHRSVYPLAAEATELFEGARDRIAAFLNWPARATIFTKNATEAVNLVAYSWGRTNVGPRRHGRRVGARASLELRAVAHALQGGRRELRDHRRRRRVRPEARRARPAPGDGHGQARRRRARLERRRDDQPGRRHRRARARRGRRRVRRRVTGRAADPRRCRRDRRRLLHLDRPQDLRADGHRRAARPPGGPSTRCRRSSAAGT